jgi:hypothetical protein
MRAALEYLLATGWGVHRLNAHDGVGNRLNKRRAVLVLLPISISVVGICAWYLRANSAHIAKIMLFNGSAARA